MDGQQALTVAKQFIHGIEEHMPRLDSHRLPAGVALGQPAGKLHGLPTHTLLFNPKEAWIDE